MCILGICLINLLNEKLRPLPSIFFLEVDAWCAKQPPELVHLFLTCKLAICLTDLAFGLSFRPCPPPLQALLGVVGGLVFAPPPVRE